MWNFFKKEKENSLLDDASSFMSDFSSFITKNKFDSNYCNIIQNAREGLDKQIMFLVVGEVNSGKSSFINALIGETACVVDEAPCTDCICELSFGETKAEKMLGDNKKIILINNELLKRVTIVDTPGSNSVIKSHQNITEGFIPNADVMFVVFQAKNPFGQSIWDLLSQAKGEWKKNVVFVMQQADLMKANDLQQNIDYIKNFAMQKGFESPVIFSVSAKNELTGNTEQSGFENLRKYIEEKLLSNNSYEYRLRAKLKTVNEVLNKISSTLNDDTSRNLELVEIQSGVNGMLEKLESRNEENNRHLLEQYGEDFNSVLKEVDRSVAEIVHVKAMFKTLKRRTALRSWFGEIIQKYEKRTNNLISEFSDDIVENKEKLNQQAKKTFADIKDEQLQFSRKEMYKLIDENHDSTVSKIKSKASNLLSSTELLKNIADKFGKKIQRKVSTANWAKVVITIGVPVAIVVSVITWINKMKEQISSSPLGNAIGQAQNVLDVVDRIKSLLSKGGATAEAGVGASAIIPILILIIALIAFYEIVNFVVNRILFSMLEKATLKAYDEYKKDESNLSDDFMSKMNTQLNEVEVLFKSEFQGLFDRLGKKIEKQDTIPSDVKQEFKLLLERRDELIRKIEVG